MTQLDLILIHPTLRLRQASLHDAQIALPWYQDLENLRLSEGESVTQPYSIETVQSMYKFLCIPLIQSVWIQRDRQIRWNELYGTETG